MPSEEVVFAILAKQKAAVLPLYLQCLLNQTYDKKKIHIYIRTNDSTDRTEEVLRSFVTDHGEKYASVFFDASSVSDKLKAYEPHEWNYERFKILGRIRQDSIEYAKARKANYFVADCDNFITPTCLEKMMSVRALGVVAPMLITTTKYLNLHYATDANGYMKHHAFYDEILYSRLVGCIKVDVVHCTYLVAADIVPDVNYDDGSGRYEYVIFSDVLRKKNIGQYYDNREFYGFITFADEVGEFDSEIRNSWQKKIADDFGIDWEDLTPFKSSYSAHGEDREVIKFYEGKKTGNFVSVGDAANVYLLEEKCGWHGIKIEVENISEEIKSFPQNIDYISITAPGKEIELFSQLTFDKYNIGYITIDTSGWDFINLAEEYTTLLHKYMIDLGFVYIHREKYDIYIHKSMFEGIYYLNGNKALSHDVSFCNLTNTLNVKSPFAWAEDNGSLNTSNFMLEFKKLGRRRLNYNSIELHANDRWVKLDA
jgi:hypothetical protein